jgi:5S rRNA maturation endonuclease (ribonuclease M5)
MRSDEERLEHLEKAIERLRDVAETGTVLVEGTKDQAALEWLGVGGDIVRLHRGRALAAVLDDLAARPPPVVVLLDWDRTGTALARKVERQLQGHVALDLDCRRRIAEACRAKCLEDLPAELTALRRGPARFHPGRFHNE